MMLLGWKRKLMNRLLASGFTGSFGYAPASPRNRGDRRLAEGSAMTFARNQMGGEREPC